MEHWEALCPGGYRFVYDDALFRPGTDTFLLSSLPRLKPGLRVMDLGCGTAVLAILAAKMGAAETTGIDIDAVAAQSGYDNVALNRLRNRVSICCGDASLLQMESYDLLLANIHRNIILQDLATYAKSLRKAGMRYANVDTRESRSDGGLLMVSGFYESDAPDIIDAASAQGLRLIGRKGREGWACLIFRRL